MLEAGDWQAETRPETGGALAALRFQGIDVLRPMPTGSSDPLTSSCFPLVPYCNRIRNACFNYYHREIRLSANHLPERHSLHGLSWQREWSAEECGPSKTILRDLYDGTGDWPWAYSAQQTVQLGNDGLHLELDITNLADIPAPVGLGLHPYFRRRSETQLRFAARTCVMTDIEKIPTSEFNKADHFADWQFGAQLPSVEVDNTHLNWSGEAIISDDYGSITIRAKGAPNLHIYAPRDSTTLCCEPVTHMADALNQDPAGMIILPPGCSAKLAIHIGAQPPV